MLTDFFPDEPCAAGLDLCPPGYRIPALEADIKNILSRGWSFLAEDMDIDAHVTALGDTGLDFMRSGDARQANATDIFSSQRMGQIIGALRSRYDIVILDAPPVMAVADARIIGKLADKTLFVVRWDKTPAKVSRTALDLLEKGRIPIVGITLQQVDLGRYGRMGHGDSGYYYHYGRYGQYYRE